MGSPSPPGIIRVPFPRGTRREERLLGVSLAVLLGETPQAFLPPFRLPPPVVDLFDVHVGDSALVVDHVPEAFVLRLPAAGLSPARRLARQGYTEKHRGHDVQMRADASGCGASIVSRKHRAKHRARSRLPDQSIDRAPS